MLCESVRVCSHLHLRKGAIMGFLPSSWKERLARSCGFLPGGKERRPVVSSVACLLKNYSCVGVCVIQLRSTRMGHGSC